ncbi:hypothetical protein N752_30055 [Desulforamulus aquiferis]|nr:hypothetical protein N752_30055 [Desulforamulus aquiferis]
MRVDPSESVFRYRFQKEGFLGYLSTIKDGATKEILAHYVSDNLKLDIGLLSRFRTS